MSDGYEAAKSSRLFRDFIDATATVDIGDDTVNVLFQKRVHNPLLLAADLSDTNVKVPWLNGKRLRFTFR